LEELEELVSAIKETRVGFGNRLEDLRLLDRIERILRHHHVMYLRGSNMRISWKAKDKSGSYLLENLGGRVTVAYELVEDDLRPLQ